MEEQSLNQIMAKANSINYDGIFSKKLELFLSNTAKTICNCKEFLMPSLITGVAHLMNYAKFSVLNNFEKGMSIFSVLIANPSTGKSPAIEKIKNAIESIEIFDGIKEENSCLVNAATVEALVAYLDQFKSIVSFWDEGQTFFGSFGLYKGSSNSSYDRSHFLDLWNAPNRYRRDLKQSRTVISKPRLSISLASHPYMINNLVKSEKTCKDDGLIQRFLLFSPKPVYIKNISEIEEANTECSLEVLFYVIKLRHLNSIEYRLDKEAKELFAQLFSKNQTHNENFSKVDTFISTICGKFVVKLLRISTILTALEEAFDFLMKIEESSNIDKFQLSEKIKSYFETVFIQQEKNVCYIKRETIERANKLLDISNITKILFAGYLVEDVSLSFDQILTCLFESFSNKNEFDTKSNFTYYSKIIKNPGPVIILNDVIQKYKLKKSQVLEIFNDLVGFGLGSIEKSQTNLNRKQNTLFVKSNELSIQLNENAIKMLTNFGVSIEDYIESLQINQKQSDNVKKTKDLNKFRDFETEEDEESRQNQSKSLSHLTLDESHESNSFAGNEFSFEEVKKTSSNLDKNIIEFENVCSKTIETHNNNDLLHSTDIPSTQINSKRVDLSEDDDILVKQKNSSSFSQNYENSKRPADRNSWYRNSTQSLKSFKQKNQNSDSD